MTTQIDLNTIPWNYPPLIVNQRDRAILVLVPAGRFKMGPAQHGPDSPEHEVELRAFYMCTTLVSNQQYMAFVRSTRTKENKDDVIRNWPGRDQVESNPHGAAAHVNWADADAYARSVGGRLPTEAEWERAARGPKGDERTCSKDRTTREERAAGVYAPIGTSGFGVLQMTGSRFEWCSDFYDEAYYTTGDEKCPQGPESGDRRVLRGGPQPALVTKRYNQLPNEAGEDIGFRYVIDLPETHAGLPAPMCRSSFSTSNMMCDV